MPIAKVTKNTRVIRKAVSCFKTQLQLAEGLGIHQSCVSQWVQGYKHVPAHYCWKIEMLTDGVVRCEELRPDVFALPRHVFVPDKEGATQ